MTVTVTATVTVTITVTMTVTVLVTLTMTVTVIVTINDSNNDTDTDTGNYNDSNSNNDSEERSIMINVPEWVISTVESTIYGLVWKGKKDRIKRTVLINNFRNGGLNMVDIRSKIAFLKANVVKRFFENHSDTLWKECFTHHLNYFGGKLLFQCDYDVKCLGTEIPAYYLHVLECWKQFYSKEILDKTIQSLSSCIVWNNSLIQIEKKYIFWEDFYEAGLIYLGDLFD